MTQAAILPQWMQDRLAGTVDRPSMIELSPDEATPFSLFVSLATQWTRHAMTGLRLGIDYSSIRPTAEMMDISMTPGLLRDIRSMEAAALDEFALATRR